MDKLFVTLRLALISGIALAAAAAAAAAAPGPIPIGTLLAQTAGQWSGQLQYRDYQSNQWEGLPVTVRIAVQPDGVTMIRTAEFDDGPQTGLVWITTITQLDAAGRTESYAQFRKGRAVDTGTAELSMPAPPRDAQHWTIVATQTRRDGDSMAQVRETTTRDGADMVTLKEVNPLDDGKNDWFPRNRLVLRQTAQ
jgi:hypothetical protein